MAVVLLVYNDLGLREREGVFSDCPDWATVEDVARGLEVGGHEVFFLAAQNYGQMARDLQQLPFPQVAFILAEGLTDFPRTFYDGSGAAGLRRFFRARGIPTTHSSPRTMVVCRHKALTYRRLRRHGLPVPSFRTLSPRKLLSEQITSLEKELSFPLFLKPDAGGSSIGISARSVVPDALALASQAMVLWEALGPVRLLAETYLPGPEFTVAVGGSRAEMVWPVISFPRGAIRTTEEKHSRRQFMRFLEPGDPAFSRIAGLARQTFRAVGGQDILRIDLKEDARGYIYIIDVNGTPSLSPNSSLVAMARHLNLSTSVLANLILAST